jgi:hypothetical protein
MYRLIFFALVVSATASPQNAAPSRGTNEVPVVVMGASPEKLALITSHNFRVSFNGRPVQVNGISYGEVPHTTYVLLDASGSMRNSKNWKSALQIPITIAKSGQAGEVKIAAFDERITKFMDGKDAVARGAAPLEGLLEPGKRTSLYDALFFTLRFMPHATPEDTIIAITDGEDNLSSSSSDKVLKVLREARVRFLVVYVPEISTSELPLDVERNNLRALFSVAVQSGGAVFCPYPAGAVDELGMPAITVASDKRLSYDQQLSQWYRNFEAGFRVQVPPVSGRTKVKVDLQPNIPGASLLYPREFAGKP